MLDTSPSQRGWLGEGCARIAVDVLVVGVKVTNLGHACFFFESGDLRVLFDPILGPTHSGGTFDIVPRRRVSVTSLRADFVFVSHVHPDHFDPESLAALAREDADTILVTSDPLIVDVAERVGFRDARLVAPNTHLALADGLTITTTPSLAPEIDRRCRRGHLNASTPRRISACRCAGVGLPPPSPSSAKSATCRRRIARAFLRTVLEKRPVHLGRKRRAPSSSSVSVFFRSVSFFRCCAKRRSQASFQRALSASAALGSF